MTIEQIKEEAKKLGKDLTDEQAQALLEKGGELTDEALEAVAGGSGWDALLATTKEILRDLHDFIRK